MELDFSQFHPLDHTVFQCKGYPGGIRRHLEYRWVYKGKPSLYAHTLCALGIHAKTAKATGREYTWRICTSCHKQLSEKQPI